mgnify:CR=1 FL=1
MDWRSSAWGGATTPHKTADLFQTFYIYIDHDLDLLDLDLLDLDLLDFVWVGCASAPGLGGNALCGRDAALWVGRGGVFPNSEFRVRCHCSIICYTFGRAGARMGCARLGLHFV